MENKQRRAHRTEQEWVDLIHSCRTSGLNTKEWCTLHSISSRTFDSKVRALRHKEVELSGLMGDTTGETQQVVPLPIISELPETDTPDIPSANESPAVILKMSDYSIEILNHAARSTILNTLSVLQQLC